MERQRVGLSDWRKSRFSETRPALGDAANMSLRLLLLSRELFPVEFFYSLERLNDVPWPGLKDFGAFAVAALKVCEQLCGERDYVEM